MTTIKQLIETLREYDENEPIIFEYFTRDMLEVDDDELETTVEVSLDLFSEVANQLNRYTEQPGSDELRSAIESELYELHNKGEGVIK